MSKTKSITLAPDPKLTALKTRATKLLMAWKDIDVQDTTGFESAGEALKQVVTLRKDLQSLPVYVELKAQKANLKLKEKALKAVDSLIESTERAIREALSRYAAQQRWKQEKQIESAMSKGKDEKAASLAAKPFVPEVSGLSFTEHWHAEVTDWPALVAWCAKDTGRLGYLLPNLVELNTVARNLKCETLGELPGVKGVKETSSTIRT